MAGATTVLQNAILNSMFRVAAAYKPAAIYIGLLTTLPSDDAPTGAVEATGGNYARQQVTQADANWNAPSGTNTSTISNVNDISWASVTWTGTVVGWCICFSLAGALTTDMLLWFDSADIVVNSGDTVKFTGGAPGALAVSLS